VQLVGELLEGELWVEVRRLEVVVQPKAFLVVANQQAMGQLVGVQQDLSQQELVLGQGAQQLHQLGVRLGVQLGVALALLVLVVVQLVLVAVERLGVLLHHNYLLNTGGLN
jgi:hypothetical protein